MAIHKASNMEKARAQIVLYHPFVASILLRRPFIETRDIPTLAVDGKARIYFNPDFVAKLTVPQLIWGLCHEVFHVVGQHSVRVGNRNRKKWNYAGDAWINDTLDEAKMGERIPKCVDMPGSKDDTVENIYANLPDNGSGDDDGDEDGLGDDIHYTDGVGDSGKPMTPDEVREIEGTIKVEIAEAAQAAKMQGKLSGRLADMVADILDVKTPWFEILEKHMVSRVNQGQTWRRKNRRFEVYLPSVDKLPQMGELVIQVDVSGSISKTELAAYNGHLSRIIEQCRPSKVHVLYTDTQVQKHVEFDCGEEVHLEFYSGGGTDMPAGFDYCAEQGIEPDVFVCLTDGYTGFGEDPGYPVVWCISSDVEAPWGENIHFELEQ
jgi:predicted metal-dependent peptidase